MRRSFWLMMAATLLASGFASNSADAGPLQRFFSRLRVERDTVVRTERDEYRRYSYEPSTEPTTARATPAYSGRSAAKSPWMYPKSDPRRYEIRN